jgi:murein DD-endopeptidase MepM/ murein hydrolase activator NlpD
MRNVLKKLLIVLVLLMTLTTSIFASSYSEQLKELEKQKNISQQEIQNSQKQVIKINNNIKGLVNRIIELDSQIEDYEHKISMLETDLANKQIDINNALEELKEAKEEEKEYFDKTKDRIKVMYEYGDSAYLDVIVKAKNISDLFNRFEYINAVLDYDSNALKRLEVVKNNIADKESKLEQEKDKLIQLTDDCNLQRNALKDVHNLKEQEMNNLQENKEMIVAEIDAKKEELRAIEKAADEIKSKMVYDGGKMYSPLKKFYMTCKFGPRIHPVHKYKSFHSGIDLRASVGTSVYAAYKGEVILATKSKVWGYYILIDHGSGYVTMYAHNSKLLVKKGDKVSTKQVIAKSGNTGWSTGPHLHFGIRKNGKWTNPLDLIIK